MTQKCANSTRIPKNLIPLLQKIRIRPEPRRVGHAQMPPVHLLEPVQEHGAVHLLEYVAAHLHDQVRPDAEDLPVERRVVELA